MADRGAAEEIIRYLIKQEGAENVARAMDTVTKSQKENSKAANDNAQATKKLSDAQSQLLDRTQRAAAGLNLMQFGLRELAPELSNTVQQFTFAAGAAKNLAASIGLGVVGGGVVGGVVAALTLFAQRANEAKKAAEELTKAQKELDKEMEYGETHVLKGAEKLSSRDAAAKFVRAQLSPDVASARDALEQARKARDVLGKPNDIFGPTQEQALAEAAVNRAEEALANAGKPEPEAPKPAGERKYNTNAIDRRIAELDARGKAELDSIKQAQAATQTAMANNKLLEDQEWANKKSRMQEESQARAKYFHDTVEAAKESDKKLAQIDDRKTKQWNEYRKVGIDAVSSVGSVGINALQALAKGQKVSIKELVAGIGEAMVASGSRWLFEGLALSIVGGAGAPLIGIGTAEIAAGLALGAATRGASAPSGAGSVGREDFVRAHSPQTPSNSSGGQYPQIVNVQLNTTVAPNPQDGLRVGRAVREAQRQGYA